jgi:hypothetical protein
MQHPVSVHIKDDILTIFIIVILNLFQDLIHCLELEILEF